MDYSSNSHKSKVENSTKEPVKKEVKKVISGTAKTAKKSEAKKALDSLLYFDVDSIKRHVVDDVIVPSLKQGVSMAIEMFLYGESGAKKRSNSNASRVSYRDYYDKDRDRDRDRGYERRRDPIYDDVRVDSRGEAEEVLIALGEIIDQYDFATVTDLYDLVGIDAPYTAANYGWTSIRTAEIVRSRDGFLIKMPRIKPVK